MRNGVSIPFKRESVFKGSGLKVIPKVFADAFPFPSNGKVYSKFFYRRVVMTTT